MSGHSTAFYGEGLYNNGYFYDPVEQLAETTAVNNSLRPVPDPYPFGLKLKEDIILGDLVLNSVDSNNVVWVCTNIEGWWVHPDPEIPDVTRGWGDGSYDASGRWMARQITLSGVFMPPTCDYVSTARDSLVSATSLVRQGAWLKTKENPTRASYVRLSGRPEIETVNQRGKTEFSIGLRAADPIKYSWNDADVDGYDIVTIPCANASTLETGLTVIENVGNTSVSVFLEITGPIVGPAIVYNSTNDELLTLVESIRDSETLNVTYKSITSNVATIRVTEIHDLAVGDYVTVSGVDSTFNGEHLITAIPGTQSFSFAVTASNVTEVASSGAVSRDADFMEIDTYSKEVAVNGETLGARVKVDTLTDWLTLAPGNNSILFEDEGDANSTASLTIYYRSGWIA